MNKNIFLIINLILFSFVFLFGGNSALAEEKNSSEIIFFYSPTCSHCANADKFLKNLNEKYPEIKIIGYEFSKNLDLVKEFYVDYNVPSTKQGFVPLIFTPDKYFVGFDEKTGEEMEKCIQSCILGKEDNEQGMKIPILGQIDVRKFSFPLLAMILGFFDGFNVCSLGALVMILGLVISMGSRKKILLFGGVYVGITILVYWALIFLWHRLFVAMAPYMRGMEIVIGLLATFGAWYFLKEFIELMKRGPMCKFNAVSDSLSGKLQNIFEKKSGLLATILGILVFAVAITVIEFPCSAVLPVLFTGILAEANVPFSMSMIYMGIYVFFYMLDEMIVLLVAAFTMNIWIASGKFMKWMSLVAGVMMAFFGLYYLVWPFVRLWFN